MKSKTAIGPTTEIFNLVMFTNKLVTINIITTKLHD